MYRQGDHIVYGSHGVCEIKEIGTSPIDPADTRTYYALHPVLAAPTTMIFTPADNTAVTMRPPMTNTQARALLERMPDILPLSVEQEKTRRDIYRSVLSAAVPDQLVALLRTVAQRRLETLRHGRRLTDADTDSERRAHNNLLGELSLALGLSCEEAAGLIQNAIAPDADQTAPSAP